MASAKCGCVWDCGELYPCNDHKIVVQDRDRYKNALIEIKKKDGPGPDWTAGPCYDIAVKALSPSCTCCHGATCPTHDAPVAQKR